MRRLSLPTSTQLTSSYLNKSSQQSRHFFTNSVDQYEALVHNPHRRLSRYVAAARL